jgi:hypothetical protein
MVILFSAWVVFCLSLLCSKLLRHDMCVAYTLALLGWTLNTGDMWHKRAGMRVRTGSHRGVYVQWRSGGEWRACRGQVGDRSGSWGKWCWWGVFADCLPALIQDVTGIDFFHLNKSLHRAICYHGVAPPQGGSVPFLSVERSFVDFRLELHCFLEGPRGTDGEGMGKGMRNTMRNGIHRGDRKLHMIFV